MLIFTLLNTKISAERSNFMKLSEKELVASPEDELKEAREQFYRLDLSIVDFCTFIDNETGGQDEERAISALYKKADIAIKQSKKCSTAKTSSSQLRKASVQRLQNN